MQSQSTEPVSAAPAREALAWAVRLSENPDTAGPRPEKPTAASWGALSVAELRAGLDELLVKRNVEDALQALQELGAFAVWLPELEAMVGFGDGEWRHKDVWKHTKQVVKQSVPRLEVRWGALLHDIGKPRTRKITDDGQVTFYGHSEVGAAMFRKKVRKRLGFEGPLADRIHFLILHHLRASQYEASWTDAAVRRFYKQMGDGLRDLLDLSRADITTKRPEKRRRGVAQISALAKRIKALEAVDSKVAPLPKGLGQHLMDALGLPPGKELGNIRKNLEREADEGLIEAGREAEYYVELVKSDPDRYRAV
ncbi:MAG: HDIG domain-containing protein [Myxococcales bacterium]|nr:HDIG domain-containing protein [Myxococcales bacterium]